MPKVRRALHTQVKAVIADLREGGYAQAQSNLHMTVGNTALSNIIRTLYKTVGTRHAQLTYSRLLHDGSVRKGLGATREVKASMVNCPKCGEPTKDVESGMGYIKCQNCGQTFSSSSSKIQTKGFGFNAAWTKFIEDYLQRFLIDKITFAVASTTREALLRALTRGVDSGLGVDGMIDTLKDWPYERFQAARIVRTEVNRAANVGAKAQAETGKYEQQKEWVAINDFRTRGHNPKDHASHVALNGTKIDAGDLFIDPRNGDKLQFPGDPNASAESTINCRCSAVFVNKRDNNGNLIPKRRSTAVTYPAQQRRVQNITI